MWVKKNGRLIHTSDKSRLEYRVRISQKILNDIRSMAKKHNTYPNYLIESGVENLSEVKVISYDKKQRPKDRIVYSSSFDKEVLNQIELLTKKHNLMIADVVELSTTYIEYDNLRDVNHRYRIEVSD